MQISTAETAVFQAAINALCHLVWPVFLSVWLAVFKKEISAVLSEVREIARRSSNFELQYKEAKLTMKDLSAEISEAASLASNEQKKMKVSDSAVRSDSGTLNARIESLNMMTSPSNFDIDTYRTLAESDPGMALMTIRRDLDIMMTNIGRAYGVSRGEDSFVRFTRRLERAGALEPDQSALSEKLYRICSAAAHGTAISPSDVTQVLSITDFLLQSVLLWLDTHFPQQSNDEPAKARKKKEQPKQ